MAWQVATTSGASTGRPLDGKAINPLDGSILNFSTQAWVKHNRSLFDTLELEPDFALRRGSLLHQGWKLRPNALIGFSKAPRMLTAADIKPDLKQKGVDIRIGLDIANLALKRIVEILVLVTSDSDFVPVMKFARKEGVKVYLDTLGHSSVRRELKAHADFIL